MILKLSSLLKGFGFVTFVDPSVVENVLNDAPHMLDSKRIEPKIAVPKQAALKAITNRKSAENHQSPAVML
ncbi:RNA-binding protein Musashi -like protein 2 [Echinococcus granulosus]|nr:RNA-binding protein Musashi -like protein 2 [Echinococcus granulosus]